MSNTSNQTPTPEVVFPPMPDIGGRSFVFRGLTGGKAVFDGMWFTLRRKELRWLAIATILLNFVLFGALLVGGIAALPWVLDWWGVESTLMRWIVGIALGIGWAVLSVFLALALATVVAGPFLEALSVRTERLLTGLEPAPGPNPIIGALTGIKELVLQLLLVLPFTAVVIGIGLIPVVGSVAALVIGWIWTSMWVSISFVNPTTGRHGLTAGERIRFVFANKFLFVGFGGLQSLIPWLFVPLFAPALTVSGARIYLALAAHDRVKSKLSEPAKATLLA